MARELEIVYSVERCSWIPEHNRLVVWYAVYAGHSARDYQAENYKGTKHTLVGKYRSEQEATAAIDALGGRRVD